MAIAACVSQYANSRCLASNELKLPASTRTNPVSPTRSTSELRWPLWPIAAVAPDRSNKESSTIRLLNAFSLVATSLVEAHCIRETPRMSPWLIFGWARCRSLLVGTLLRSPNLLAVFRIRPSPRSAHCGAFADVTKARATKLDSRDFATLRLTSHNRTPEVSDGFSIDEVVRDRAACPHSWSRRSLSRLAHGRSARTR